MEHNELYASLVEWFAPFGEALGHKKRACWAPVYLRGLLSGNRRKSVEPMAQTVAPGEVQQLHHFVSTSEWPLEPVQAVLVEKANALVGGADSVLIIDDTALVKKGRHSAGVGRQYCGELGKNANCQALVSLTLAREEVPVPVALRLFLPASWEEDTERRQASKIPEALTHQPKWAIALEQLDRIVAWGAEFGLVAADAGYGGTAEFRQGLSQRGCSWAVGVASNHHVYPADTRTVAPRQRAQGRPQKHPRPTRPSVTAEAMIANAPKLRFRAIEWREGTQGPLRGQFARIRVRPADGPPYERGRRLPGEECWLVCERRSNGEYKYYLSNLPASTRFRALVRAIKSRWVCEQAHQQMKQELGLDHFEGRSWLGLHHHALMVMIAYAFLQHTRLAQAKPRTSTERPTQKKTRNERDRLQSPPSPKSCGG